MTLKADMRYYTTVYNTSSSTGCATVARKTLMKQHQSLIDATLSICKQSTALTSRTKSPQNAYNYQCAAEAAASDRSMMFDTQRSLLAKWTPIHT